MHHLIKYDTCCTTLEDAKATLDRIKSVIDSSCETRLEYMHDTFYAVIETSSPLADLAAMDEDGFSV